MKHVIIGTAGHVDHGKTTLIQALTGTNPDRLKEEQERGMTIDLGFALLRLPDGTIAGVVDVPGHERFLKNMLAGASGVDVVLLVVAADEGVMPQTEEHLNILRLLDVRNGVIALTKMDMVEKEWTDIVEEDIRTRLKDSFLANSPIIRVSSRTGKGIEALKKALQAAVSRAETRNAALPFRLPVDRVFSKPGFGTIVTGTLVAGTVRTGDQIEILPEGLASRVRGLQVHGTKVSVAEAGNRVAINLVGLETAEINRGSQVVYPQSVLPTQTFDGTLRMLDSTPKLLEDRERVRVHIGTAEILGRIKILGRQGELGPGETEFVQFTGEEPFVCVRGDRFVLRSYSPMLLLGGGIVLEATPSRHRKADQEVIARLQAIQTGSPSDLIQTALAKSPQGLLKGELGSIVGLSTEDTDAALGDLIEEQVVTSLPMDRLILSSIEALYRERATSALANYHAQFPLRGGMPREELRNTVQKDLNPKSFHALMSHWHHLGEVSSEGALVRLTGFQVQLTDKQQQLLQRIADVYIRFGAMIPSLEDVAHELRTNVEAVQSLMRVATDRHDFYKLEEGVYLHAETVGKLQELVRGYLKDNPSISVGEFRDMAHSNRRLSLLILEYFDKTLFTRRVGDARTLY